jgi:hypothetical protein
MILEHDYVYVINVLVSTLFPVMHFPHDKTIVTIDQLEYDNNHHSSTVDLFSPLYVHSDRVNSSRTWVN